MKAKAWKAFLPIPSTTKSNEPPADALWLAAHGIEREALQVLRVVRRELQVLNMCGPALVGFHFLVHTREEGVPCAPDDHRAFIDLSLYFDKPVKASTFLPTSWLWVTPRQGDTSITKDIELLNKQSDLYLQIVGELDTRKLSDLEMLMQIRQQLHYFANMSQCRIA